MGGKEEGKKKGEELGFIMSNKINKKMFMSKIYYIHRSHCSPSLFSANAFWYH